MIWVSWQVNKCIWLISIFTDYYKSLAFRILDVDEKSVENKKNDAPAPVADTEDPLEVEKTVEAAQLTLAKVLTYQIPEYNELEIVGKCILYMESQFYFIF